MSAITLRLPNSVHGQAKQLAAADGASINNFIVSAVAEKIAARRTIAWLKQQATDYGSPDKILAILESVPDVPAMPGDELPAIPVKQYKYSDKGFDARKRKKSTKSNTVRKNIKAHPSDKLPG
jgi:uncharacterized protein (DUF1778 family)